MVYMTNWYQGKIISSEEFYKNLKSIFDFKALVFVSRNGISTKEIISITDKIKEYKITPHSINFFTDHLYEFKNRFIVPEGNEMVFVPPLILLDNQDLIKVKNGSIMGNCVHFISSTNNIGNTVNTPLKQFCQANKIKKISFLVKKEGTSFDRNLTNEYKEIGVQYVLIEDIDYKRNKAIKKVVNSLVSKKSNVLIVIEDPELITNIQQAYLEIYHVSGFYIKSYFSDLFLGKKPELNLFNNKKLRKKTEKTQYKRFKQLEKDYSLFKEELFENFEETIELLLKLLDNILKDELNKKYRLLKTSSEKLNNLIFNEESSTRLLITIGFKKQGETNGIVSYENSADFKEIKETRDKLFSLFNQDSQ